ncbi:REP-associated tyrosine transposase [Bradymonas sediminis]|uniref:REP-associated tyrosine transposase n=1 Tax=Bradymonas sediminis TaxID=1548548 RepID=UPI0010F0A6B7|nr:transposase [Bradymonas sediminis]TDP71845.1 REP element-mobilizing transposase RayT [Bradymonas sediminis]
MDGDVFRGWYSRGYLPHFDSDSVPQMVTYRLADSLPHSVVRRLLNETTQGDPERRERYEALLDGGYGACVLRQPENAQIVIDAWEFYDGSRYRLLDWCVMPNHVHITYERPTVGLSTLVKAWKTYTSKQIKTRLGTHGDGEALWQAGFFDRFARDARHLFHMQCYIWLNPVRAGLVDDPFEWPYSSIHNHARFRPSIMRWWEQQKERFWDGGGY